MLVKKSELKRIIREEAYRSRYTEYMRDLDKLNRLVNEALLTEFIMSGAVSKNSGLKLLREGSDRDLATTVIPILREHALLGEIDWRALGRRTGNLAARVGKGALDLGWRGTKWAGGKAWDATKAAAPHVGRAVRDTAKWGARKTGQGIASGYKGAKALYAKGKQGTAFSNMAQHRPHDFLALHKATEDRVRNIFGSDIRTPQDAERMLGMLQTDAGVAMLDDLVSKSGMSSSEITQVLNTYVHQAEFIRHATAAIEDAEMSNMGSRAPVPV